MQNPKITEKNYFHGLTKIGTGARMVGTETVMWSRCDLPKRQISADWSVADCPQEQQNHRVSAWMKAPECAPEPDGQIPGRMVNRNGRTEEQRDCFPGSGSLDHLESGSSDEKKGFPAARPCGKGWHDCAAALRYHAWTEVLQGARCVPPGTGSWSYSWRAVPESRRVPGRIPRQGVIFRLILRCLLRRTAGARQGRCLFMTNNAYAYRCPECGTDFTSRNGIFTGEKTDGCWRYFCICPVCARVAVSTTGTPVKQTEAQQQVKIFRPERIGA